MIPTSALGFPATGGIPDTDVLPLGFCVLLDVGDHFEGDVLACGAVRRVVRVEINEFTQATVGGRVKDLNHIRRRDEDLFRIADERVGIAVLLESIDETSWIIERKGSGVV